ncbi:MAG: hypothetical protein GX446_04775, partial [Chthonomonadales bacterium]|nr:hypothetical protein [Chthonomonadales bacterium]
MAPGLGIAVRFVHGMIEGLQLDGQIAKLRPTADQNVLDLVPASFRDCARLRLLAAQCRTAGPETQSDAGAELVRAFNGLRKEAMEEMMEAASGETATRADMLRLVQSMDELARATRSDVAVVA